MELFEQTVMHYYFQFELYKPYTICAIDKSESTGEKLAAFQLFIISITIYIDELERVTVTNHG